MATKSDVLQIEPTPARGKLSEALYDSEEWDAEEKYDGDRRLAHFHGEWIRFTGRRIGKDGVYVEKSDNVPHLSRHTTPDAEQLMSDAGTRATKRVPTRENCFHLRGTVLDGEIVVPGGRSKDVTSIMGSLPEKAVEKQLKRGWIRYVVFDCLFWKGKDIRHKPRTYRRRKMIKALELWGNPHATKAKRVTGKKKRSFLKKVWERGGEGIVLKHKDSKYTEHLKWVKVKKELTADVVIMGYTKPKKVSTKVSGKTSITKYAKKGWIGSIVFGLYVGKKLVEYGQVSGMTDGQRKEFSVNGEKYIGEVMEIEAAERELETGAFRHPRFVRMRPDLNAKDQTWVKYEWQLPTKKVKK